MNERMRTRAPHKIDRVVLNARFHARARNLPAALNDRLWIRQRLYVDVVEAL